MLVSEVMKLENFTSNEETVLKKSIEELEEEMGLYFVSPEKISLHIEEEQ
ncbi:hypothetical protein V7138_16790 [Bacillus sp. JJ1533]